MGLPYRKIAAAEPQVLPLLFRSHGEKAENHKIISKNQEKTIVRIETSSYNRLVASQGVSLPFFAKWIGMRMCSMANSKNTPPAEDVKAPVAALIAKARKEGSIQAAELNAEQ